MTTNYDGYNFYQEYIDSSWYIEAHFFPSTVTISLDNGILAAMLIMKEEYLVKMWLARTISKSYDIQLIGSNDSEEFKSNKLEIWQLPNQMDKTFDILIPS